MVAPLLEIRPVPADLELEGVTALAFTSRNGVEAFSARSPERGLPVFTVGDATAETARTLGFRTVRSAGGALADLADLLIAATPGLVLAPGALEPAGDLPGLVADRVRVRALPIYEAVETGVPAPRLFDAVLVHSARAARALGALAPFPGRVAVALSDGVASAFGDGSGLEIRIAAAPDEAALLEALGKPAPRV